MMLWTQSVEILRESIFAYAQACHGNLGAGILAVTFLVRLALLPLGIRIARAAAIHQRAMTRIQPQLDALRRRYKDDPRRLAKETSRLMKAENISPLSLVGCVGGIAQVPIFVAFYSAVRQAAAAGGPFLWIKDLARPDGLLAVAAALLTCLGMAAGGASPSEHRSLLLTVSAVVTMVTLWKMAAGVGLYWGLSSLFGAAQGWVVHTRRPLLRV